MNRIIRVAIADDQVLFRESLVKNIESFGHMLVVAEADNGQLLLDKLAVIGTLPDIVLLDLNMPVLNGLEATKRLRVLYPELKIIILSVHGEEKNIARMVQLGVHGFIAKNSGLAELCRAIDDAYDKGYYFNDAVIRVLQSGILTRVSIGKGFDALDSLTRREKEVLLLICKEYTTAEIAQQLFLSERTVEGHRNSLLEKTGARNTAGLVLYAMKNNLEGLEF